MVQRVCPIPDEFRGKKALRNVRIFISAEAGARLTDIAKAKEVTLSVGRVSQIVNAVRDYLDRYGLNWEINLVPK